MKFYYAVADPKVAKYNRFIQNSIYAIVFKLWVILLIMGGIENSESSYYSLSYWDRDSSYSPYCSYEKSS